MIKKFFSSHFTVAQLSLKYDDPTVFINSQWQKDKSQPSIIFFVYRICQALIFLTILGTLSGPNSLLFFTFWSYILDSFQFALGLVMLSMSVLGCRFLDKPHWKDLALKPYSLYWLTSNTSTIVALMVTIVYWSLLYGGQKLDYGNVFSHAVQSVQLLIDLCVSDRPVRILHLIYAIVFGLIYTAFNVSYYFIDRHNGGKGVIYNILDWGYPQMAITTVLGNYVVLTLLGLFIYGIYRLRVRIHDLCVKKEPEGSKPAVSA